MLNNSRRLLFKNIWLYKLVQNMWEPCCIAQELNFKRNFKEILGITEDFELDACNQDIKPFYTVQLLTYLILDDLVSARFLWKRIPQEMKKNDVELQAIWAIGQRLWVQDYAGVYVAFKANWSPLNLTLTEILNESFRERTFAVVSKAYSIVSERSLALYLGLSVDEAVAYVKKKDWEITGDGFVKTKVVSPTKGATDALANMQSLTNYVIFLES